MLKTLQNLIALFFVLTLSAVSAVSAAESSPSAKQLLEQMEKAKDLRNYEFIFVQAGQSGLDTLRYRHFHRDGKNYAQLTTLDGVKQEIIRRDNLISYFQANYQPFTIQSTHIIDSLPGIMHANFERLTQYYDFINIGRNRVADRVVQTIRILPKDHFRYQYVVFIDEENHLLLRSDMIDRDNNLLEQFRVVNLYTGEGLEQLENYIEQIHFPPLLTDTALNNASITAWETSWLPPGFKLVKEHIETEEQTNSVIESRLYSDGLFFFTLYVSDRILPQEQENLWNQGGNTIYSENSGNKEITLIGQLPVTTAKRIVQDIKFKQ